MIVARSFSPPSSELDEKNAYVDRGTRPSSRSRSKSPLQSMKKVDSRSGPVEIPSRNKKSSRPQSQSQSQSQSQPQSQNQTIPISVKKTDTTARQIPQPKFRKESAQDILSATAIPIRKRVKPKASQRLPKCDYVADFSRLLQDDIQYSKDGSFPRNHSLPQLDSLFGHIDGLLDGQIIVGSEGVDESGLSARSISSDSLASLSSPDDFSSGIGSHNSPTPRSISDRRTPLMTSSENCADNHPLAKLDEIDELDLGPRQTNSMSTSVSPSSPQPSRAVAARQIKKPQPRSSFKSTLTSSLKALKSAARTTLMSSSGLGPGAGMSASGLYTNQSLLAHTFFDIQPSLTDDKRPPPAMTPPSPELRRYLNPQMATGPPDSPTQLHFWQDERYIFKSEELIKPTKGKKSKRRKRSPTPKSKLDSLPSIVPLSTCLPPTVRTANASSPPIWLTPDGEPINKNLSTLLSTDLDSSNPNVNEIARNREPRENRDFLRMYVCEMQMRRNGKLSEDLSSGRARLWLPPVADYQNHQPQPVRKQGADRWKVWTANHYDSESEDDSESN